MLKNNEFIDKLRSSGLRPTKQRLKICEVLFNREKTFHFTINDLSKIIKHKLNEKISLATVYNTVHAFKIKGYLKEISINSDKSYFDTNTSIHHHFYDEDTNELIDCNKNDIDSVNVNRNIPGKKIKSVEVLIKIASDNHNQYYSNNFIYLTSTLILF
jgi:Fur family iron response transcriptional regulator